MAHILKESHSFTWISVSFQVHSKTTQFHSFIQSFAVQLMFALCCVQMADSLMHQVQQLKMLIDQARQHSENDHDSVFEMLRAQFEKEKAEVSSYIVIDHFSLYGIICNWRHGYTFRRHLKTYLFRCCYNTL